MAERARLAQRCRAWRPQQYRLANAVLLAARRQRSTRDQKNYHRKVFEMGTQPNSKASRGNGMKDSWQPERLHHSPCKDGPSFTTLTTPRERRDMFSILAQDDAATSDGHGKHLMHSSHVPRYQKLTSLFLARHFNVASPNVRALPTLQPPFSASGASTGTPRSQQGLGMTNLSAQVYRNADRAARRSQLRRPRSRGALSGTSRPDEWP